MNDETTLLQKPRRDRIFSTSTRGWLAIAVITTVCSCAFFSIPIEEPLYTLSVAITSFYFGQNLKTTGTT